MKQEKSCAKLKIGLRAVRIITQQTLAAHGYRVLVAANGAEALALYAQRHAEIALVLTYLIGVLCILSLPLAAAVAVGQTGILFARERLHAFANNWLRPAEVRDGILLAALALIVGGLVLLLVLEWRLALVVIGWGVLIWGVLIAEVLKQWRP